MKGEKKGNLSRELLKHFLCDNSVQTLLLFWFYCAFVSTS